MELLIEEGIKRGYNENTAQYHELELLVKDINKKQFFAFSI